MENELKNLIDELRKIDNDILEIQIRVKLRDISTKDAMIGISKLVESKQAIVEKLKKLDI